MEGFPVERVSDALVISTDSVTRTVASENEPITLPMEIWVIILTMVVDPESLHCDYCTTFDFFRLNREWNMLRTSPFTDINGQVAKLRLVCRLWSVLLDPIWRPYVKTKNFRMIRPYKNIRALSFDEGYEQDFNDYKSYPLDQALLGATRNINTLMVYYGTPSGERDFVDSLFSYSEYFPNLRSFFYITEIGLPHDFWPRLETAFPRLTALTLLGPAPDGGSITLPNLEILDIDISTDLPPAFHIPSLKHLASDTEWNSPTFVGIIQTYGEKIESLLLPCYEPDSYDYDLQGVEPFGEDFWTRFPKLKLFGSTASLLDKLPIPPTEHGFNHLCIYDVDLDSIQTLIVDLYRLRYFSLFSAGGTGSSARDVIVLDEFLIARGAKQFEIRLYGDVIHPEIEQLWKRGSWQKSTYYPSVDQASYLFTWEI